jgi:hypothetical protein
MLTTASLLPLRLATYSGLLFSALGFLTGLFILLEAFFTRIEVPGYTSISLAIVIFSGIQLFCLGILGEYVGRIFQMNHRSSFILREHYRAKEPKKL